MKNFVVYFQIARLQDRIAIVQQHMASEQCSGGPHCMLQDGMFVPPFLDPAAQVIKPFFYLNIAGFLIFSMICSGATCFCFWLLLHMSGFPVIN